MRILLEREDVAPDTADEDGRTPLSWAAGNGHGYILKMLLEWEDVTPDTADKGGQTPLLWAAEFGNEGVVDTLLEREDVTPDTADKDSGTPLSWAKICGHFRVVGRLLLWRVVNQTALAQTSERQRGGALKRRLRSQGSVPQLASSDSSIDLSLVEPLKPS